MSRKDYILNSEEKVINTTREKNLMERMKELWQDIIAWFKEHAVPCYKDMMSIKSGATEEQLHEIEVIVGRTLPDDFKDYLRLCNRKYRVAFFEYSSFDTVRILKNWQWLKQRTENGDFDNARPYEELTGVQKVWWHPFWLPFAEDGGGNKICIDLDPPEGRGYGQVFYWEIHAGPCEPKAPSFLEFIEWYRDELLTGNYTYDEYTGIFIDD